jgi:hypothetical protein
VRGKDGMLQIRAKHAGTVDLRFGVDAEGALAALAGSATTCES